MTVTVNEDEVSSAENMLTAVLMRARKKSDHMEANFRIKLKHSTCARSIFIL
jgi:hypothetical protein